MEQRRLTAREKMHDQAEQRRPRVWIGVFRHYLDRSFTKERVDEQQWDQRIILEKLSEKKLVSIRTQGRAAGVCGRSGYLLKIAVEDLPKWQKAIDELHAAGTLKYYDRWGVDEEGHGLIPIPKD